MWESRIRVPPEAPNMICETCKREHDGTFGSGKFSTINYPVFQLPISVCNFGTSSSLLFENIKSPANCRIL